MPGVLIFLLLLLPRHTLASDDPYLQAAADCAGDARVQQEIRLNSGVYTEQVQISSPLTINISREINEQQYLDCLQRAGLEPDAKRDPYLKRIRQCSQGVTTEALVVGQGQIKIGSNRNARDYQDCLRGIQVELLPDHQ